MMAATRQTSTRLERHPFAIAIIEGDHPALVETLASDVVLHSAVANAPFEGRDTVADVYASVIESFDHVEVVDEFATEGTYVFFWRGRMEGRFVEGADRLRLDESGNVREITVLGRPLSGLATFLTGIGSRFANRRRGRGVATVLRLTSLPLPPTFSLLDPVTRWLAGRARDGHES
jgi:hypothetical protein